MSEDAPHATIEAIARNSYGQLLAYIAARSGDVAQAEDGLSEAFQLGRVIPAQDLSPPRRLYGTTARQPILQSTVRRRTAKPTKILLDGSRLARRH